MLIDLPKKERHDHDCDACIYLGSHIIDANGGHKDTYYCPKSFYTNHLGSVVIRDSSEGSDYSSAPFQMTFMVLSSGKDMALSSAIQKIFERGYIVQKEGL